MEAPGVAKWLLEAEKLLPRMELDHVREQLGVVREQAELLSVAQGAADGQLTAAMDAVAESLLPEFSFDTPAEERQRDSLVRDLAPVLPSLVRPLWRARVEGVLQGQGKDCRLWGTRP